MQMRCRLCSLLRHFPLLFKIIKINTNNFLYFFRKITAVWYDTCHLTSECGCTIWVTFQVNLSFVCVCVCVWVLCVLVGCLSRVLKSRRLERGRRCSCKYLMSSMCYHCPALHSAEMNTWMLWAGGVGQHLSGRQWEWETEKYRGE